MGWLEDQDRARDFAILKGLVLVKVTGAKGDEVMRFECADGRVFELWYEPDCCASCQIEDICGDLSDLVGEVLTAEEVSNSDDPVPGREYTTESYTWTFYRIGTARGLVTVRWLGESNGYYSESVSFREVAPPVAAPPQSRILSDIEAMEAIAVLLDRGHSADEVVKAMKRGDA